MAVQLTQEMINGAIITQQKYGVPASVTLGQIMLESGGDYPHGLSGLAYNDNNLFGIKAGSNWDGKTVTYKTAEYGENGKYYTNATFRKYDSVADSINDHGKLLASPIYTNKTAGTTNLNDYVRAMGSVYATSPTYADNLLSVINANNLTKYDTGVYPVKNTGTTATVLTPQYTDSEIKVLGFDVSDLISKITIFVVIVLIIVLAVVLFMRAFDVHIPTKKDLVKKGVEEALK